MKKLYILLFTILISTLSFGQTTIFQESFETGNSGTTSIDCNDGSGDFFTRTDGSDISSSYQVSGVDGAFFFAAQDIDATECGGSGGDLQTLLFDDIDISTFSNLTLALLLAEDAPSDGNFDWDGGDLFYVEVDYDNTGSYTKILQFATTATTGSNVSLPSQDTDLDGIGDGTELSPTFGEFTIALGTGNLVDVRLVFDGLGAGDEDIAVDNIRIIDGFVVSPAITIVSPLDTTVFAPGTTNVNIEWTTVNLAGGETVDIDVNGTVTTGVTSPYAVTTTDGQAYNITVNLMDGASVVDFEGVDFSVGSLTQVADVTALKADVVDNGLGRFYEITGSSLLTHTDGFRNRKWIQDTDISGVLIYDDSGVIATTYAVGDMITGLKGYTTDSNGVLRFIPTSDSGVIASSGNPVVPQTVTISDLNTTPDNYESELIKIANVTFPQGDGTLTFSTGQNFDVFDGALTTIMRTDFFGADYIGEIIPQSALDLVGVAGEFQGTAQIYVRSLADINTLGVKNLNVSNFSLYPNPTSTGFVTITSNNSDSIQAQVFDTLGKQVLNNTISNNRLNVSSLNAGLYIVKLTQDNTSVTKKLVIK